MEQDFNFQLSGPLNYSKGGDFVDTHTITFKQPGMETFNEQTRLAQLVMSAMMDARKFADADAEVSDGDAEMNAAAVKMMIYSSNVDAVKIFDQFKFLAVKVATCDGEEKLKQEHFNKITVADATRMMCEFIAVFTVPSLLSEMEA